MIKKRKPNIVYGKRGRSRPQRPFSLSSDGVEMFFPKSEDVDTSQKPPPQPPRKPTSQKAATMPAEPKEEDVETFMTFTDAPRGTAVRYLKAKNNNIEQAVDAFLNGEDISKLENATQWDESLWSAGKDGDTGVGNDQYLKPLTGSAAATRPNSPAPSTRSNLHPTSQQEAEDDFQRALAMSKGEEVPAYQGYAQQESGVVGPNGGGAVFGPATRDYYEKNEWAMVPVGAVVGINEEVIPDAALEDRVHLGEPRMLKPLPGGDYTANLLTICAAIDGARETLLMREHVLENYGSEADWWRGHPISLPKIVHMEDGRPAEPESDKQDEILAEVQRLMALLSASKRSYGSAQALTQTQVIKNSSPASTPSRTLLEFFLQQWAVAAVSKAESPDEVTNLFSTIVGTNDPDGMDTPDMSLINAQIAVPEGAQSDLFEVLDSLLWNTDADGATMADNYIERPAEILVMRMFQASAAFGNQLRVEVPAQFYVDKYLKENIEATRATRAQMARAKKRITKIEEIEKKLKTWKHPKKNEQLDAGLLLKHTLGHFSGQNRIDVAKADKTNSAAVLEETPTDPPHYAEITAKLEKVIASIDNKLNVLAEEKAKTRKAISEMSKAPPPGLEQEDLKYRYTLRGVATKPNITYVTVPTENDAADAMFDDETTPAGLTWWRLEYEANASGTNAKLNKTKADDFDVLRAVELEHNSTLLVYASDRMNAPMPHALTLPFALQEFIENDNAYLHAEIQKANDNDPPAYNINLMDDIPRESIERTSMDSTRVEGGGGSNYGDDDHSPPSYEEDGFMDHHGFGLGPPIKQGYAEGYQAMDEDADGEVHEIKLDDLEDGMEMSEKVHEPLIPGLASGGGGGDAVMGEAGRRDVGGYETEGTGKAGYW